jgi:hypothetical protein
LKFSDVILAVATINVISVLIMVVLYALLISPLGSTWGMNSASIISELISGLLIGYLFAIKIQEESRIRSIAKITVVTAFVQAFVVMISFPTNAYYAAWTKETLQSMYQTGSWTNLDWFAYAQLALVVTMALNVALALVLIFVSVYAGSMLRKPKKT